MTPAHTLAEHGLHVFPLRGKVPAGGSGHLDATSDPDELASLLERLGGDGNVGLQPGRSGLLVVDLDETKEVGNIPAYVRLQEVAERHGGLPRTLTVRTGSGGRHLYFKAPRGRDIGQMNGVRNPDTGQTESGVDVRCGKGYVVAPPSVHPKTGKRYEWVGVEGFGWEHVADCPAWLLDFLDPPDWQPVQLAPPDWQPPAEAPTDLDQRRVQGMVDRVCDDIGRLGPGMSRRTELQRAAYRLAGMLWTGYPESALYGSLVSAAHACGHFDSDTDRCIRMAIEAGKASPMPMPPDSPEWNERAQHRADLSSLLKQWAGMARADLEAQVVEEQPEGPPDGTPDPLAVPHLELTKEGPPKGNMPNVAAVLTHDRRWAGRWWFDSWRQVGTLDGREAADVDVQELRDWLHHTYSMLPSTTAAEEAVQLVSFRNRRDPVVEWLESLVWDGTLRLDAMLRDCFGVQPIEPPEEHKGPWFDLPAIIGRKWMISAVSRALNPGCQVDTMLVLQGPQGARKTSGFRELAGAHLFSAPAIDPGQKDSVLALHGSLVVEWAELDSLKRSQETAVKAFISERQDKIRVPYARRPQTFQRRNVFVGTTNDDKFLTDETGDRRFWVVRSESVDLERIREQREQLWAEAVARLRNGEEWWLTPEEDAQRDIVNEAYRYEDPWVSLIERWVAHHGDGFELDDLMYDKGQRATRFDAYEPPGLGLQLGRASQYDRQRAKRLLGHMGLAEKRRRLPSGKQVRRWERS